MSAISVGELDGDQQATVELAESNASKADRRPGGLGFTRGRAVMRSPWTAWDDSPLEDDYVPEDLVYAGDPELPDGPAVISEQDRLDAELDALLGRNRYSRVDEVEWQEWDGIEQDAAEREMLRREAPVWVSAPPGAALAAALEVTRPEAMSPMALIELMKAANRLISWGEAIKAGAMASFVRQRRAEHRESPRPAQLDSKGRPIDPERSWHGEIALALGLSPNTVGRRVETALRLTSVLSATYSGLRCGALTWGKALAISEATSQLPDQAAQAVEAHVLKRAAKQTHRNLQESLRRQVAKHTAPRAADDHRAAVAERTCKIVPLADGMAGLWVVHTADKIQQMWVTIQAMAALAKRDTRSTSPTTTTAAAATDPSTNDNEPAPPTTTANPTGTATGIETGTTPRTATDTASGTATGTPGTVTGTTSGTVTGTTSGTVTGTTSGTASGTKSGTATDTDAKTDTGTGAATDPGGGGGVGAGKDARTAEQRRADVIADLFERILHNGLDWLGRRLPDQHRRRPHIEVVVPASTLLGLDDDPCELTGYGPIPADMARRIAADGTWRRLLTDPTNGTVLEASTTRHDPGVLVTETLLARHPVCAWPGCNRTSRDCDRDHATPFAQSGQTTLTGLVPYCEYHHVIKDTKAWGWTTTTHPNGSVTLTTPTGHRYTTVPPARGPITPTPQQQPKPSNEPPPF